MKRGAYTNYVVNQNLKDFLCSIYNEIEYPISGERLPFDNIVKEANNWVAYMESLAINVNVKTLLERVETVYRNKFTSALIISFALAIVKARGSSKVNLRISGKVIDAYYGEHYQPFELIQKYFYSNSPLMLFEEPEEFSTLKSQSNDLNDTIEQVRKMYMKLLEENEKQKIENDSLKEEVAVGKQKIKNLTDENESLMRLLVKHKLAIVEKDSEGFKKTTLLTNVNLEDYYYKNVILKILEKYKRKPVEMRTTIANMILSVFKNNLDDTLTDLVDDFQNEVPTPISPEIKVSYINVNGNVGNMNINSDKK